MAILKQVIQKIINEQLDLIAGGKSRGMSLEDIAHKHKVSITQIENELKIGKKVEMEHTKKPEVAFEIAKDHLFEIPDYYTRLVKMEKSAEK